MGDIGDADNECILLHPNYRYITIQFLVPKDLSDQEIMKALTKCLHNYVKENSKIGYNKPYYIKETCV